MFKKLKKNIFKSKSFNGNKAKKIKEIKEIN